MEGIAERYYRLKQLEKQLLELENEEIELMQAEKMLDKISDRRIYRVMKNFMIEITREEALQYIRERIEVIDALIAKISREIEKLKKELSKT